MKFWAIAVAATMLATTTASGTPTNEDRRKLYALGEAGPEYCPNIETGWFKMGAIGYDMSADESEWQRYKAAKNDWFQIFRKAGSQAVVCQFLMDKFGPGTDLELFQYK